jgi:hypothetical protein
MPRRNTLPAVGAQAPAAGSPVLADHVAEINRLGKRIVTDAIEIGRRLTACRYLVGHGNWIGWLSGGRADTDACSGNAGGGNASGLLPQPGSIDPSR